MAAVGAAARAVLRSTSLRNAAARAASAGGRPAARLRPSAAPRILLRSPVEMSSFCVESLLPRHTATASALMTSLLSVSRRGHGWLSEGQDETR